MICKCPDLMMKMEMSSLKNRFASTVSKDVAIGCVPAMVLDQQFFGQFVLTMCFCFPMGSRLQLTGWPADSQLNLLTDEHCYYVRGDVAEC